MNYLEELRLDISSQTSKGRDLRPVMMAHGYMAHLDDPTETARAYAAASLFREHRKHIYPHDRILGSLMGCFSETLTEGEENWAKDLVNSYGRCTFTTNTDHFAPDYETFLADGIPGTLAKIENSQKAHAEEPEKVATLEAMKITLLAFRDMVDEYGAAAEEAAHGEPELLKAAEVCRALAVRAPESFREALQLVWLCHVAFWYEGRYAMALGRVDQYLLPYYEHDEKLGMITPEEAESLLACTFLKIGEYRSLSYRILGGAGDDVVNIAIAGMKPDGSRALNPLSWAVLYAVRDCNIPGPNLSARLDPEIPEEFLDACLKVIGTGLGYPALMNDAANVQALYDQGYAEEDARDYCMVGCIENFLPGKQPPWSDGRYNSPKYLELALNDGVCMLTGVQMGPRTGKAEDILSMEAFIEAVKEQMRVGAAVYMAHFRNENDRYKRENYTQPFLSLFCRDCVGRGLDIRNGGAIYPSVHGAACMGIATIADSLAAVEKVVFEEKSVTLAQLRDALKVDFEGYEPLRRQLLNAPKYGNGDPYVDRYAAWYVDYHAELFGKYRTPDGGRVYIGIASNTSNIPAGLEVAATPDGRRSRQPMSDAASPMHGMDKKGPTAVIRSVTVPDYTKVACGTVINQKYSPEMFNDPEKRALLRSMIRVYLTKGGQEMQINSISRDVLQKAMEHPEDYESLVVRVSGFSAYYTSLDRSVQEDILKRTTQG